MMVSFLGAHGYEPGPTQRPLLAGAITGLLATPPAIALLWLLGSLQVEARILGTSVGMTLVAGEVLMAVAGAVYARLFGRAANDPKGGWLFGMAFGFALWTAGAVLILPLVSGGLAPAGEAAIGTFVSLVVWGGALGALLPFVHRPMHEGIRQAAERNQSGPAAATQKDRIRSSNSK
jgi:hypothetical protein